jgi:hypothetical protein
LLEGAPDIERLVPAKSLWMRAPLFVGDGEAPLMALPTEAQAPFLARAGLELVEGALPAPGTDGAVVHEAVLRARGMRLGTGFGQNLGDLDDVPDRFTVVGVVRGEARVGLVDLTYASRPASVLARVPDFRLVYAQPGRKAALDDWLAEARLADGRPALRVFDARFARERQARALANVPLFEGFITLAIAIVVALVTSLLHVLGFQARAEEFALLLAVGHARRRLAGRLAGEALAVSGGGFVGGVLLGLAAALAFKLGWLEPRGVLVQVPDLKPILLASVVPLLSALVSAWVLARRLARTDPVAILQRRGRA